MQFQIQRKSLKGLMLLLTLLVTGCAQNTITEDKYSGFLDNYSILKPLESDSSALIYRVSGVDFSKYKGLIVDDVKVISASGVNIKNNQLLADVADSYKSKLIKKLTENNFNLLAQPEVDSVRLQVAITSVYASFDDWDGYQYIPVAAVVAGVKQASGISKKSARVMMEAKFLDAKTGQLLGEFMDLKAGKEKEDDVAIKLDDIDPVLEQWSTRVVMTLIKLRE